MASKYRLLEILVTCSGSVSGKDIASFSGWLEKVRSNYNIRLIFADGQEEVMRWTEWLCVQRDGDGDINAKYLSDEETEVISPLTFATIVDISVQEELFLSRIFNVYNSQIILACTTLQQFMNMSHDKRMEQFHHLVSQRNLVV